MRTNGKWNEAEKRAIEDGLADTVLPAFHDLAATLTVQFGNPITTDERRVIGSAMLAMMFATVLAGWSHEDCDNEEAAEHQFEEFAEELLSYTGRFCGVTSPLKASPLPKPSNTTRTAYHAVAMANIHHLMREVERGCSGLSGAEEEQAAMTLYGGLGLVMAKRYIRDDAAAKRWLERVFDAFGFKNSQVEIVSVAS